MNTEPVRRAFIMFLRPMSGTKSEPPDILGPVEMAREALTAGVRRPTLP